MTWITEEKAFDKVVGYSKPKQGIHIFFSKEEGMFQAYTTSKGSKKIDDRMAANPSLIYVGFYNKNRVLSDVREDFVYAKEEG